MLLQRVKMVAKKSLVDDKITACVKRIVPALGVMCKVSNRKILSTETCCFLAKRLLSIFKYCSSSTFLFFYELLIGAQPTFLECAIIFLKYDYQLCLIGPGYSNRTVKEEVLSYLLLYLISKKCKVQTHQCYLILITFRKGKRPKNLRGI